MSLVFACNPPLTEVDTEITTTTSSSSQTSGPSTSAGTTEGTTNATSAGSSTGDLCPPIPPDGGGYDACPGLCGGGGQCFNDGAEYAVCTRGCFMACDCWQAPGGDAPVACRDDLLETTSLCVLDCSGGQTCPDPMYCEPDLGICVHPYPGTEDSTTGMDESSTGMDESSTGMGSTSTGMGSSSGGESSSSGGSTSTGMGSSSSGGESSSSGGSTG